MRREVNKREGSEVWPGLRQRRWREESPTAWGEQCFRRGRLRRCKLSGFCSPKRWDSPFRFLRSVRWIGFGSPVTVTERSESERSRLVLCRLGSRSSKGQTRSLFCMECGCVEFGLKRDVTPTEYYLLRPCNNILETQFYCLVGRCFYR